MKKIMNQPESFVIEMCKGFVLANPELEFIEQSKVIKKKEINSGMIYGTTAVESPKKSKQKMIDFIKEANEIK
jgi:hypothetical protein